MTASNRWEHGDEGNPSNRIRCLSFGDYTATRDELLEHTSRIHQAIRDGSLSIEADSHLGLQDDAEAQHLLQSRNTSGRLVLTVAQ